MSSDFLGHPLAVTAPTWQPRPGQWVTFHLSDPDKQAALAGLGAHLTAEGKLVAIFSAGHFDSPLEVRRGEGPVERQGGTWQPARLMLVDTNGDNLPVARRMPGGHMDVASVFFYPDSPSLVGMGPLTDLTHLPPGYTPAPGWNPAP